MIQCYDERFECNNEFNIRNKLHNNLFSLSTIKWFRILTEIQNVLDYSQQTILNVLSSE